MALEDTGASVCVCVNLNHIFWHFQYGFSCSIRASNLKNRVHLAGEH